MTRNTSFFVGVTALLAVGYPACADEPDDWDGWNGYARAQARLAHIQQRRATYLPRRYQTANAFDVAMGPGMRTGAAWLIRSKNGIQGRIMSNVSTFADPYTLWIVIFNDPSACDGPCDGTDLANPAVGGSVANHGSYEHTKLYGQSHRSRSRVDPALAAFVARRQTLRAGPLYGLLGGALGRSDFAAARRVNVAPRQAARPPNVGRAKSRVSARQRR